MHPSKGGDSQDDHCYKCGKKEHYAWDFWHKKKGKGNAATSRSFQDAKHQERYDSEEEEWDVEAIFAVVNTEVEEQEKKEEIALTAITKHKKINY